ncbi:MAG: hypothetical protein HOP35_13315 [Nitrospira sp.]|nr:hypothetical protein [Nitrospira sp.]
MNRLRWRRLLTTAFLLCSFEPAHATIENIEGTLTCRNGCNRTTVQKVAQGGTFTFRVFGQWVDTASEVQSDFNYAIVNRKHGQGSYIDIKLVVGQYMDPGERTVKIRYPVEVNGYDSFKLRVVKRGTISSVMYKRPRYATQTVIAGAKGPMVTKQVIAGHDVVPPVNLPLNQPAVLVVSGTQLIGLQAKLPSGAKILDWLDGATTTRREIRMEFSQSGQGDLQVYDSQLSDADMYAPDAHRFVYTGENRHIQYGGTLTGALPLDRPAIGSTSPGLQFIDVAPRAVIENLFRPLSPNAEFTNTGGTRFFRVDQRYCAAIGGLEGTTTIAVPHPIWGVANVGTLPVTTAFASHLRSGNQVLSTENTSALNPGQDARFTFVRPNGTATGSPVRVTKLNAAPHIGCFISPELPPFVQDPLLTVNVNTDGGVPEQADQQVNNSRTY